MASLVGWDRELDYASPDEGLGRVGMSPPRTTRHPDGLGGGSGGDGRGKIGDAKAKKMLWPGEAWGTGEGGGDKITHARTTWPHRTG